MTALERKLADDLHYQRVGVFLTGAILLSRQHLVGVGHRDGDWCVSVHTGKREFMTFSKASLVVALDRALTRLHADPSDAA